MARRRGGDEGLPFSLDSFLDIVANLVGILIRLIVMVGLSVRALPGPSQALKDAEANKSRPESTEQLEEWKRKKHEIETANAKAAIDHRRKVEAREQELATRRRAVMTIQQKQKQIDEEYDVRKRAVAERLAVLQAFEKQAVELAGEIDRLASEKSKEADLLDRELAAARRLELQVDEESKSLAELKADFEAAQRELDAERIKRESLDDQIADLRKAIAEIEAAPKPVQAVLHDATSVASRVEIEEVHYRIKNGRIAPTYMTDLLELLRRKVHTA
jgi:chromosome segregation ATPase